MRRILNTAFWVLMAWGAIHIFFHYLDRLTAPEIHIHESGESVLDYYDWDALERVKEI